MAMTVQVDLYTGSGPTIAATTAVKWNREDTEAGTTPIPTPTTAGTNFSYIKSFRIEITATDSLTMTDIKVGKLTTEPTGGSKLWYTTEHAVGAYVQAVAPPAATVDDNVTAPVINSSTGEDELPLLSGASPYDAGPYNTTGVKGPLVEICLGIDSTNVDAGTGYPTPTLRWEWTEA